MPTQNLSTHVKDAIFEDAECRRICDLGESIRHTYNADMHFSKPYHKRSQVIAMFFSLFFEVNKVQATILQTLDGYNLQTGHHGRLNGVSICSRIESMHTHRGVRSMRTKGNQANVAMAFTARLVVRSNYTEPSIFACSPRIRLKGTRMEARDFAEVCL